eukprot:7302140-Pyramimonas_sp.AAC.1
MSPISPPSPHWSGHASYVCPSERSGCPPCPMAGSLPPAPPPARGPRQIESTLMAGMAHRGAGPRHGHCRIDH